MKNLNSYNDITYYIYMSFSKTLSQFYKMFRLHFTFTVSLSVQKSKHRGYTVHCTLYTVHCTLYTVHCTLYTVHCTLYTIHCTLYTVQCTLYTVHCTLYTVHCTMYTVHCTLYRFVYYLFLSC